MNELIDSIGTIKGEIQTITEYLYQQHNMAGMERLNILLSELSKFTMLISRYTQESNIEFDLNKYMGILTDTMKAMEAKDNTLVADILQYDLLDQMSELEKQI